MTEPIEISRITLAASSSPREVFDLSGRCAFAICTKGQFRIKILNEQYSVSGHSMFACMPFVNIEVLHVDQPSEIIFGSILIQDMPRMINRWVEIKNLTTIQNHPLVSISFNQFRRIMDLVSDYHEDLSESISGTNDNVSLRIRQDIIEMQSRLIVAQVLKTFLANLPVEMHSHTQRDEVFQRFMITLYANFREKRNVQFYAMRSGVSLKYFSTVIRQFSGSTPSEWIETVVVSEAKTLLADNNLSIKDIATTLNFPDAPTFTKYFHRITGLTPKAFRKSLP